ncbi:MAG: LppP/LprE family lipoprotein [Alphaproteobacteria bacterium]|nr:LppP/LprE family lipoprotein [Alphaproteobacteria bacterium]
MKLLVTAATFVALISPCPVVAQPREPIKEIGTKCLETILRDCKVLTAGYINSDQGYHDGEPMLAWQTQSGVTFQDGVIGGFVLFQYTAGKWVVADSGFDGWRFSPPRLNEAGLVHIAGYTGGTGAYNVDRLYQWRDRDHAVYREGLQRVDMNAWYETTEMALPEGLEIWKGVQYEFEDPWSGMIARTRLWRPDDANCCPTGGSAVIIFQIEDDRLVVAEILYFARGR